MATSARPSQPKADTRTGGGDRKSEYSPPDGYGVPNEHVGNIVELMRSHNRNVLDRTND
jgi:hypothetical protein